MKNINKYVIFVYFVTLRGVNLINQNAGVVFILFEKISPPKTLKVNV